MNLANSNEVDDCPSGFGETLPNCFSGFSERSTFRNDSHFHPEKKSLSLEKSEMRRARGVVFNDSKGSDIQRKEALNLRKSLRILIVSISRRVVAIFPSCP